MLDILPYICYTLGMDTLDNRREYPTHISEQQIPEADLGRAEILDAPAPEVSLAPILDPDKEVTLLTVEAQAPILEDKAIRLLLDIMSNPLQKTSDRLAAAKSSTDLIGRTGKNLIIKAKNAQLNNFTPELLTHLKRAGSGLTELSTAEPQSLNISSAGRGE